MPTPGAQLGEIISATYDYTNTSPADLIIDTPIYTLPLNVSSAKKRFIGISAITRNLGTSDYLHFKLQGSFDKSTWHYVHNAYDGDFISHSDVEIVFTQAQDITGSYGDFTWFSSLNTGTPLPQPYPFIRLEVESTGGSPSSDAAIKFKIVAI